MQHLDHLKNLVIMAAADGSLNESEIALLVDRCTELGLSETELEKALSFALSDKAALKLPTSHPEKIAMLTDLMRIMAADGQLREMEKRLFAIASAKMNIDRDEIEKLIDRLVGKHSSSDRPAV
ncbi:MAG: TerB family tellurite resistance protein [Pirellulaceae bacterium]|nr:TerB family tellurite resistance protein [Pirellulaceae bacterium]